MILALMRGQRRRRRRRRMRRSQGRRPIKLVGMALWR